MNYETIKTRQEGRIFHIQLNRPESRNAINMQMVNELLDAVNHVYDANDLSVLVFTGQSDVFSTGVDLCDFTPEKQPDIYGFQKWEKICSRLRQIDKLVITAIKGECYGGGFDLLLNSDIRIAEHNTVFCLDEVKLGFIPGMTIFLLAKYIGLGRAKQFIITGQPISSQNALNYGLIDEVCDIQDMDTIIEKYIEQNEPFNPVAVLLARRLLNESFYEPYEEFIGHYLAAQHRAINSEGFIELIKNAKSNDEKKQCRMESLRANR